MVKKKVVNKLREDKGFSWWDEYEVLRRKYNLGKVRVIA